MISTFILIATSWMHVFTDGTNPIRVVLFALYLLALYGALSLSKRKEKTNTKRRILQTLVLGSILLLFVAGLVGHLWVYTAHTIPQHSLAVFFDSNEITNTRLTHNHAGKSAIAALVAPISSQVVQDADTGAGIASFFSPIFSAVTALLFLVAVGTSLMLAPSALQIVSDRGRIAGFILYGLVAFVMLEKAVDGGILNDGAIIALSAYLALVLFPARYFYRLACIGAATFLIVFCGLLITGQYWGGDQYATGALINASVLFLIISALHTARREGWRSVRTFAIGITALSALTGKAYADVGYKVTYLATPAYPDSSYFATYASDALTHTEPLGSIGRLRVLPVGDSPVQSIGEVIDTFHLPYWYQPVSTYKGSCAEPQTILRATFTVHVREVPKERYSIALGLAELTLVPSGTDAAGWFIYDGFLSMHPCVPRRWDVLREMLRNVGIERSIVHGFSSTEKEIDRNE